jgi:hypothetical protein
MGIERHKDKYLWQLILEISLFNIGEMFNVYLKK